jgi:hypothetical protein
VSDLQIEARDNPTWAGYESVGEILTEAFIEEDPGWYDVYFPHMWSYADFDETPSDGMSGPPVSNPLEFYVYLKDVNERAAVIRHYDVGALLRECADSMIGGDFLDGEGAKWADATAAALEKLAADLRAIPRATPSVGEEYAL